jgi:hypothetical protein
MDELVDSEGTVPPAGLPLVPIQQKLDKKLHSPDAMLALLRRRKSEARGAWWKECGIKKTWKLNSEKDEVHVYAVVYCLRCKAQHGGVSINPGNFASSHFGKSYATTPVCLKHTSAGVH